MRFSVPTPKDPRTLRRLTTALFPVAALLLTVMLYLLSYLTPLYFFVTERPEHTVGDTLSDRLSSMDRSVTVRFCMAEEDLTENAGFALVYNTARQYAERYPDKISLLPSYNVYLDHAAIAALAEETSASIGETAVIVQSAVATRIFDIDIDFWFLDESQRKNGYLGEEVLASAFLWVQTPAAEHPVAYFTTGHGENIALTGLTLPLALSGYRLEPLDLAEERVPDDAAMVVISNPLYDFEKSAAGAEVEAELDRLALYLDGGGSVFLTVDAGGLALARIENLRAFLSARGIAVEDGILYDGDRSVSAGGNILSVSVADAGTGIGKAVRDTTDASVLVRDAAPLTLTAVGGYTAAPLLVTSSTARNAEEIAGQYTVAAIAENQNGGTLVFHSGAYLCYNDVMNTSGYANRTLLYAVVRSFGGADAPLGATVLDLENTTLEGLTRGTSTRLLVALSAVLPLAVLGTGTVLLLRRRRR